MKYFYFISDHGEINNLELISNPDSSVISELYNITQIDGWDVQFQAAELNDKSFLSLVAEINDEGSDTVDLPTKVITAEEYLQGIICT